MVKWFSLIAFTEVYSHGFQSDVHPETFLPSGIGSEQPQKVTNNLDAELEKKLKLPPKQIVKGRPKGKRKLNDTRKKYTENAVEEDVDDDLSGKPRTMTVCKTLMELLNIILSYYFSKSVWCLQRTHHLVSLLVVRKCIFF